MHPFGLFLAIVARDADRARARRRIPEEPLPPIDDATVRAWRAWGRDDGSRGASGTGTPRRADSPALRHAGTNADGRA